ncbi:phospholipase [Streptomyces sp. RB6PN25]|uniref:phospholipase C n=1 Tax=Streptomyces humicola TaxID=2953240 RepID=A0ABT1Q187_9ACTN|nr:alkaline phosphatase family protein [Streptomyces humicola]MCQ4083661.1 phospholipase [Streptomyces humicola]
MSDITRRRLLGLVGGTALSLLPPTVQKAVVAGPRRPGSLADIEHVVLLMQENRSFDHYFGTMPGVRGFDDPHPLVLPTGRPVFHQPDPQNPDGYLLPFHLDTRTTSAQAIPSTSHAWQVQHQAWNGGKMDNWLPAHWAADGADAPYVMGYYTCQDIPFQFALAETFTVCDNYFCSVMGPTWPNRMYWMTGTIDPNGRHGGPILGDAAPAGGCTWTTYAERLQAAGVSWKVYQQVDNNGCNMLANFARFQDAKPGNPLYDNGMAFQPAGAFENDARRDRLPTVSWIIAPCYQCEHPHYLPAAGADYVASKIEAIASNPQVWNKTAFILNYDENDGLFDHVLPPTPVPGTSQEFIGGWPIGAGFRVPCIIVSPWTVGGRISGEAFDHTSCLRFLERITGVAEPNISAWRRRTFGDLTSAFSFDAPMRHPPQLPKNTARLLTQVQQDAATLPKPVVPAARQGLPHQESGRRRRR